MSMAEIELRLPDSSPLDAWQIGSSAPPAVCLCCGTKFDETEHKIHGPYLESPYIYACDWCWKKDFLYFPDKIMRPQFVSVEKTLDEWTRGNTISFSPKYPKVTPKGRVHHKAGYLADVRPKAPDQEALQ